MRYMGLLTDTLKNPIHSAVLGLVVAVLGAYAWVTYTDHGRKYAEDVDLQIMYLQAAAGGAVLVFAASYLFFAEKQPYLSMPAAVMAQNSPAPGLGMSGDALGGEQTMLTEPFD